MSDQYYYAIAWLGLRPGDVTPGDEKAIREMIRNGYSLRDIKAVLKCDPEQKRWIV